MDREQAGPSAIKISFSVRASPILLVLTLGLLVRLGAAFLPALGGDVSALQFWSELLADRGPWNFYTDDFHTAWPPGYLYVLWLIGGLDSVFAFTGHASWHDMPLMPGDRHLKWVHGFDAHEAHWEKTRQLIEDANSEHFAALLGYEWHSSGFGDYWISI